MTRSLKKGPFIDNSFSRERLIKSLNLQIWSRRTWILPHWIGSNVSIYNGKTLLSLKIKEEMIGHKFGEFASTRRKVLHKVKKKIIKKK